MVKYKRSYMVKAPCFPWVGQWLSNSVELERGSCEKQQQEENPKGPP